MADVIATYAVHAGTTAELTLDTTDMDPNAIALYLAEDAAVDVSVCHQCAHDVVDPQVAELTGFTVDGVDYERDPETQSWVKAKPAFRYTLADRFGGFPR